MSETKALNHLIGIQKGGLSSGHLITSSRTWLHIGDIMSKDVATARPDDIVVSAAKSMADKKISSLVILSEGNIAGILTETDVLRRVV